MNKVVIAKINLVREIERARKAHQDELLKARKNWKKETAKELKAVSERADSFDPETGKFVKGSKTFDNGRLTIDAPPIDMTPEYDRVLKMLKLDTRDEIELDDQEFRQYVENDWSWRQQWRLSNSRYL